MTKSFRLKLMIIIFSVLALIVSATAFSVSYAKWVRGESVTASGAVGEWTPTGGSITGTDDGYVQFEILEGDGVTIDSYDDALKEGGIVKLEIEIKPGTKFKIIIDGEPISFDTVNGGYLIQRNGDEYFWSGPGTVKFTMMYNKNQEADNPLFFEVISIT